MRRIITHDDPINIREVMYLEDGKIHKNAMVEEMTTLGKNQV